MSNQLKMFVSIMSATVLLFVLSATATVSAQGPNLKPGDIIPDQYIIILANNVNSSSVANALARQHRFTLEHVYGHALKGFSARIDGQRLPNLRNDSRVVAIVPDRVVSIDMQTIPTGITRIFADQSSTMSGNGSGQVDVDVAVIDTGIDQNHPDLNVVGGVNCMRGPASRYNDVNGHGTHVAGIIGAKDNDFGVVGVAPGARLWAVRVLNRFGTGSTSTIICGIDWVTSQAATIEVANMSLSGGGSDDGLSCNDTSDPYKKAICNAVNAGITVAVAAGNQNGDAGNRVPAAYDMVITVSALADFNGLPGGLGNPTCYPDVDDTLADFSNYGADVDIIAPGVCILSTWKNGSYNTISGTSMASPHVAGAAALYLSNHPGASPQDVQAVLQNTGNFNWDNSDDPDGVKEPLLDVSTF